MSATMLAFVLHVAGGTTGLISGTIAIFSAKGGRLHRVAGTVFVASMLVMAVFAAYLAVVRPGQIVNLVIAIMAFYLVATAWLTVRRRDGETGLAEKIAFAAIALLCAPFGLLSFELATGLPPFFKSAVALEGPVMVAIYGFTTVVAIATLADARMLWTGGVRGAARIARHLWRMCLGLTLAAGSAFTNGLPRLLPGPMHVPWYFFLPQFVPLVLLVFWMIRVRLTGWYKQPDAALVPPQDFV
jgi:uncharacterized membrane protein